MTLSLFLPVRHNPHFIRSVDGLRLIKREKSLFLLNLLSSMYFLLVTEVFSWMKWDKWRKWFMLGLPSSFWYRCVKVQWTHDLSYPPKALKKHSTYVTYGTDLENVIFFGPFLDLQSRNRQYLWISGVENYK